MASELTMLLAIAMPMLTEAPVSFRKSSRPLVLPDSLLRSAWMWASVVASKSIAPAARIVESVTAARERTGCAVPSSVLAIASAASFRTFCAFQPTVLNARVTPTDEPWDFVTLLLVASMEATSSARTETSPRVVSTVLDWMSARASDNTMLVAITPLAASPPPLRPPEATTVESTQASIAASSVASIVSAPVVRSARSSSAWAVPRTSLRVTRPPTEKPPEGEKSDRMSVSVPRKLGSHCRSLNPEMVRSFAPPKSTFQADTPSLATTSATLTPTPWSSKRAPCAVFAFSRACCNWFSVASRGTPSAVYEAPP